MRREGALSRVPYFGDVDHSLDFDEAADGFGYVGGEDAGRARGELGAYACRRG